jgi:ribonuclease T1
VRATETPHPTTQPTPTANAPPTSRASDLPTIAYDELPPEAHETIALIDQGGPFPFRQDGSTFQNRERLLPRHLEGYYREYTVITPRADNRGARRIVTGEEGEMYYTDDHYGSFREIIR